MVNLINYTASEHISQTHVASTTDSANTTQYNNPNLILNLEANTHAKSYTALQKKSSSKFCAILCGF
jgi:hypothetical protein